MVDWLGNRLFGKFRSVILKHFFLFLNLQTKKAINQTKKKVTFVLNNHHLVVSNNIFLKFYHKMRGVEREFNVGESAQIVGVPATTQQAIGPCYP